VRNTEFTLLVALLGSGWAGCTCPDEQTAATPTAPDFPGMENSRKLGDLLFGGQPSEEILGQLARSGYRTVLSARGEGEIAWDEKARVESLGMKFVSIPMPKPPPEISDEQVAQFADAMKTSERPMVLHCSSGNRAAALWAVWLVEYEKMEPKEALRLAKQAGLTKLKPLVEERLGVDTAEE
jgi:uncharacterized protein (TIGR01244 family)